MATSMLRLGRLGSFKCLQLESLGVLRSGSAAALCTQAEETANPTKKTKAARKTETPDERATLLAYKTAVAFPVRFSQPWVFPTQSIEVAEPVASSTATTEAVVAATATLPVTVASDPSVAMPQTEEASSASSHPAPSPDVAQVVDDTPPSVVGITAEPLVSAAIKTLEPFDSPTAASPLDNAVPNTAPSSNPGDPAADISSSSLSSSDSDSDSNSDSDSDTGSGDEKSEVRTETKTSPPLEAESIKKEAEVHMVTIEMKEGTSEDKKDISEENVDFPAPAVNADQETAPTVLASIEAAQATMKTHAELVDFASEICTAAEDTLEGTVSGTVLAEAALKPAPRVVEDIAQPTDPGSQVEYPAEVMAEAANPEKNPSDAPIETTDCASAEAPGESAEAAPEEATTEPLEAQAAPAQVAAETTAEASAPVESPKEMMDTAPVIAEAVEADLQAEATVEPSEEIAVAAPPEPEEPFDNSTYKNYQHHCYTPYTFADLDVEMAKFRLPQPSSGRPSPRH